MSRDFKPYTKVFDANAQTSANFTAAVTDIITDAAHGLSDDDPIVLTTTTTLPAGLELLTVYYVQNATTNTFQVSTTTGNGDIVDITDTGTGTHTWTQSNLSKVIFGDGRHITFSTDLTGTVTMTVKLVTSNQEDCPDFLGAVSSSNYYDTTEFIDLEDGDPKDGDTGLVFAATGSTRYAINTDSTRWAALKITSYTNGTISAIADVAID